MQTWAKRGVRAALVTGGVLAVGTTMAAAEGTGRTAPGHPSPAAPDRGRTAPQHGRMVLSGSIDPVRDLLPAIEHDATQELPVLRDQGWLPPQQPRAEALQLAGWVADPATARPAPGPGSAPRHGMRTPSEGFHRSLSWAGSIGDIVREPAEPITEQLPRVEPEGLLELWRQDGLVDPRAVDLTSGDLSGPAPRLHTLPRSLLSVALAERPHQPQARTEVPLEVPGEHQLAAHEPPTLHGPMLAERAAEPGGVQAPLPLVGELNALGGGSVSGPTFGRLTEAVGDAVPALDPHRSARAADPGPATVPFAPLRFAAAPQELPVQVTEPDPVHSLVAERDVVASNPFPQPRAAEGGGVELPLIHAKIPSITAVQGHTLPVPGITADRGAAEDTVEFQRI